MLITNAAIKNRTTVFVLILLIVVTGTLSYVTVPREAAPDVEIPNILVTTTHEGVAPADVENTITRELEQELAGLRGLKELTSSSAEGSSVVMAEFYPDVDIEDALQRVRDKVSIAKAEIPEEAD
ncbi:MAG: efflux RND transporter permease subunit, partial [Planctomycetota bacterium]